MFPLIFIMVHCTFNSVSGIIKLIIISKFYFNFLYISNNTLIIVNKIINPESNYCYVGTVQEFVLGDLEYKRDILHMM